MADVLEGKSSKGEQAYFALQLRLIEVCRHRNYYGNGRICDQLYALYFVKESP